MIDLYAYFQWERGGAKRGFLHSYRHEINAEMASKSRPAMPFSQAADMNLCRRENGKA